MTEYKLQTPIVLGEETIEVLKLEDPSQEKLELYDYDYADQTKAKGLRKLVCACVTNCGEAHIRKMKPVDIVGAGGICANFFD